jgi:nicotinate phosphoribosyltransferase
MGVSADAPYLDMAYKMVKYAGRPVMKLSPGKATLVSDKQIFRYTTPQGKLRRDVIGLRDDELKGGEPLLQEVMAGGKIRGKMPTLPQIQKRFRDEFSRLPERYKLLLAKKDEEYPVSVSPRLLKLQAEVIRRVKEKEIED